MESRSLETVTCSRCGGSGSYSYCQRFGSVCFKCAGTGKIYTKRGQVAYDYLQALRSKTADKIVVGDFLWDSYFRKFAKVNGIVVTDRGTYEFQTSMGSWSGYSADSVFRVGQTAEQKQITLKQALDYQDTLTKNGTVRKVRVK